MRTSRLVDSKILENYPISMQNGCCVCNRRACINEYIFILPDYKWKHTNCRYPNINDAADNIPNTEVFGWQSGGTTVSLRQLEKEKPMGNAQLIVDRALLIDRLQELNKVEDDKYAAASATYQSEIAAGKTKKAKQIQEAVTQVNTKLAEASAISVSKAGWHKSGDSVVVKFFFTGDYDITDFGGAFEYEVSDGKSAPKDPAKNDVKYMERKNFLDGLALSTATTVQLDLAWQAQYLN